MESANVLKLSGGSDGYQGELPVGPCVNLCVFQSTVRYTFSFQSGISPLIGEKGSPLDHVSNNPSCLQEFMVKVRVRVNPYP